VEFYFHDPVLAKSAAAGMNYSCAFDGCLLVDAPVPARRGSWGTLKSLYR
jgi:hypothetical protein